MLPGAARDRNRNEVESGAMGGSVVGPEGVVLYLSINAPVSEDALEDVDERPGLADEGEFDRQQHRVLAAHVVALAAVGELAGHELVVVAVDAVEEFGEFADGDLDGAEGGVAVRGGAGDGLGEAVAEVAEKPVVEIVGVLAAGGVVVAGHGLEDRAGARI